MEILQNQIDNWFVAQPGWVPYTGSPLMVRGFGLALTRTGPSNILMV